MRPGPATIGTMLIVAVLGLSACGGEESAATGKSQEVSTSAAAPPRASGGCKSQLGGFLSQLEKLRDQLAVGLTYGDYMEAVRDLKATYADLPVDKISLACLMRTATPAESALNEYIEGVNTWGDCLAQSACELAPLIPKLKSRWSVATKRLVEAREGLG